MRERAELLAEQETLLRKADFLKAQLSTVYYLINQIDFELNGYHPPTTPMQRKLDLYQLAHDEGKRP